MPNGLDKVIKRSGLTSLCINATNPKAKASMLLVLIVTSYPKDIRVCSPIFTMAGSSSMRRMRSIPVGMGLSTLSSGFKSPKAARILLKSWAIPLMVCLTDK